jgi:hypothetical protein
MDEDWVRYDCHSKHKSLAEHDRESRAELARQIADNAPRGELKIYPCAPFDFYRPGVRAGR